VHSHTGMMTPSPMSKVFVCTLVVLASLFISANRLDAAPVSLSINAPSFLIPIGGESGILDVYADGSAVADPTGFNALGTQALTLAGNSTSSGDLLLNFHFSGFPLGDPNYIITEAILQLTIDDLDFQTDYVTEQVTLKETATITSAGGQPLSVNLSNYLPTPGMQTDEQVIALNPIPLIPNFLPAGYFSDPFVVSIRLSAQVWNTGSQSLPVINTPERLAPTVRMDFKTQRVPEPGSIFLLGTGLAMLGAFQSRRRQRSA